MSSCCGGNCGCGTSCKCGDGCKGCKTYPDMSYTEKVPTEPLFVGVTSGKPSFEGGAEMSHGSENGGCKCNPCNCNPCNCK